MTLCDDDDELMVDRVALLAERDRLKAVNAELVEALERAQNIRHPNVSWTKAETARSWDTWDEQTRAAIRRAKEN